MQAAEAKFPSAEVWIPLINFSDALPLEEQSCLAHLNGLIDPVAKERAMAHCISLTKGGSKIRLVFAC